MTLGSLMNWAGFGKGSVTPSIERYHSAPEGWWDHKSHGHGSWKSSSKGNGNGAALSALALLAFLFLLNVMQQSLQDNNSTAPMGTGVPGTTLFLREDQQQVRLAARDESDGEETDAVKISRERDSSDSWMKTAKGDMFDGDLDDN